MLIISKFKDFYDAGASYGIDKKKVFNRKDGESEFSVTHIHHEKLIEFNTQNKFGFRSGDIINLKLLYFCGKIYACYKIIDLRNENINKMNEYDLRGSKLSYIYCYTEEDLEKNEEIINLAYSAWVSARSLYFFFLNKEDFNISKMIKNINYMRNFINENLLKSLDKYSKEENVPYFLFELKYCSHKSPNNLQISIEKNPILKEIKFGKILSPFEAFGQIEQHLFAYLDNDPEMVEISDKDKAVAHGHDGKYSFKTPPEEKK